LASSGVAISEQKKIAACGSSYRETRISVQALPQAAIF
jgi:hypothetical protein